MKRYRQSKERVGGKIGVYEKIYVGVLFVVSLALLYIVMPSDIRFGFEFQRGNPWLHETLYAPYDFPLLKSEARIEQERDSLLVNYKPLFDVVEGVGESELSQFSDDLQLFNSKTDSAAYISVARSLKSLLASLYNRGLVSHSESVGLALASCESVMLRNGVFVKDVDSKDILTLKDGYGALKSNINRIVDGKSDSLKRFVNKLDLERYIIPTVSYNAEESERLRDNITDQISLAYGAVQKGERIVSQGEVVSGDQFHILESLKATVESKRAVGGRGTVVLVGKILFLVLLLSMIFIYGFDIYLDVLKSKRKINLLISLLIIFALLSKLVSEVDILNIYMVPVVLLAILVHTFIEKRIAIFSNTVLALVIGFFAPNPYEYVLLQFVAGTVAVISLTKLQKRGQSVTTALYVFLAYTATYFAISSMQTGSIELIDWRMLIWFGINSLLLTMAQPLGWMCEKFFGFVSDTTLIELADTNHPLLRKLAEESPGTFQHSMQVANISEQAAFLLGGNPLKARVGALYHDIGKSETPLFFTENQSGGASPHDLCSLEESASTIIQHVENGVKLAKKYRIPSSIVEFITSHHGTSVTGYFYGMKGKEIGFENVDRGDFTYPGPIPVTLESSIVMMADGVEAASRSLPLKDRASLEAIINKIIDGKISSGQLDNAPITFRSVTELRGIFLNKLMDIYHTRIAYPDSSEEKK